MNTGNATFATKANVTLITGQRYYATVVARNRAGVYGQMCSEAVLYDGTPPTLSSSTNGDVQDVTSDLSSLTCRWTPFRDPESGLKSCSLKVRDSQDNEIAQQQITTDQTSTTINHLQLKSGQTYTCQISCENGVGLSSEQSSNRVLVDDTPPTPQEINAPQFWSNPSELSISWQRFTDEQSGLSSCEVGLGFDASKDDVYPFTSVQLELSAILSNLTLQHGSSYYVTVKCTNKAGLTAERTSSAILVDLTPPEASRINDSVLGKDINATLQQNGIAATWSDFSDAQSGIAGYMVAIGTRPGGCQVLDFTPTSTTSFECQNCELVLGQTFYITVKATNGARLTKTASSDGVKYDNTPPVQGTVFHTDVSGSPLRLQCNGFRDTESAISSCLWNIFNNSKSVDNGSISCKCSDCSFTIPRPQSSTSADEFTQYSLQVTCRNGAGLNTSTTSDIDVTPPGDGTVTCKQYSANNTHVKIEWSGFEEPQSPQTTTWTIGSQAGGSDIMAPTQEGLKLLSKQGESPTVRLLPGAEYHVSVTSQNAFGLAASSSCKTIIDTTHPTPGQVQDGLQENDIDFFNTVQTPSANWHRIHR